MKRLFVLAALMMAFATAPAFAGDCKVHSETTKTEKPALPTGA
jgi:hypothetical protein|tara:strand:- start:61 stop:189 length:129 start_codon:yes stop_codon:yes gene_type:complete